jgi:hypothetical protein
MSYPNVNAATNWPTTPPLQAMLAEKPTAGGNTWLISHGVNVLLATGYHPNE